MTEMSLVQAVNLALKRAMTEDSRVLVLGEDVGIDGGVFRATDGLFQTFGADRVMDTPLAEASIAGLSVGLAAQGLLPVAEIQFTGFAYTCIDQLLNHASRLRARTRGRLTCPMVLRSPAGGGIKAVEHHSESPEAMFAHIPGLKVVVPSSPARAYGLLLSAIRDPDPVVFLEPTRLYRAAREDVSDDGAGPRATESDPWRDERSHDAGNDARDDADDAGHDGNDARPDAAWADVAWRYAARQSSAAGAGRHDDELPDDVGRWPARQSGDDADDAGHDADDANDARSDADTPKALAVATWPARAHQSYRSRAIALMGD